MIIHHMTPHQLVIVEEALARLTENGWVVPSFLDILWEKFK